ncbi:MAG: hypothetical protein V2G42_05965 [bacterium JZ-2024 1]
MVDLLLTGVIVFFGSRAGCYRALKRLEPPSSHRPAKLPIAGQPFVALHRPFLYFGHRLAFRI